MPNDLYWKIIEAAPTNGPTIQAYVIRLLAKSQPMSQRRSQDPQETTIPIRTWNLNIRNVPEHIWCHARRNAAASRMRFRDYVIELLRRATTPSRSNEVCGSLNRS
ncbi:MAG: hypothetical protein DWQ35_13810 [Planctomycetota bacterium]|nr:MAG: hypothetical protein DWQ35_13810 [Planctomycetota bacterium]REK25982.1 MAG: hypothetical protein DWQ42_10150 [Planctomycetota bacterium]REK46903.1 MAG: hypothetical protein DWQ46_05255 [Planctomycetota bacterium]